MGLSPGAPRGAPEARANLSASGGKGNTAKSKIVSIAPPLLSEVENRLYRAAPT